MPGSVIRRLGHTIGEDGIIHYQEVPSSWEEADELAGHKVDRRRRFCIMAYDDEGVELCASVRWTYRCSGCTTDVYDVRGDGCHECGYRGVRRNGQWVPWRFVVATQKDAL